MNPRDPNVFQIQEVAAALGPLRDRLVFVGGCATSLLVTDAARPPVRPTKDVDLIAEVASKPEYYELASALRRLGFSEDTGDVLCRWRLRDLIVDVMPTHQGVLDFTNTWYENAVKDSVTVELPDHTPIRLITAPYFIATKLEAFYDRGQGQYGTSHDIEDIINVVDGRESIVNEVQRQLGDVRAYLKDEIDSLLSDRSFVDSIPQHFRPNAIDQSRVPLVLARLREIAGA